MLVKIRRVLITTRFRPTQPEQPTQAELDTIPLAWDIPQHNRETRGVPVEHVIAQVKQWQVLATGYRGRLNELPDVIATVVALEFFRVAF